jgi:hypothetical protein
MVALFTTEFSFPFPWPALAFAVINKYPNPLAPHVISIDVLERSFLPDGTIRSERVIGVQQDSPGWVNRVSLMSTFGHRCAQADGFPLLQLLGSQDVTYVREVSFVVPSSTAPPALPKTDAAPVPTLVDYHREPPKLLMASTNLTLAYLLQCRETISYLPHPWPHAPGVNPSRTSIPNSASLSSPSTSFNKQDPHPLSHASLPPHTTFNQAALIFSTGIFASTAYPPTGISTSSPIEPLSQPRASTAPQRAAGRKVEKWSQGRFEMNAEKGRGAMEHAAWKFWRSESGKMEEDK